MDRPTQKTNQEPSSVNPNLPPELREAPVEPFSMSLEEANNLDRITTWPPVGASEPDYEALNKPEKKSNKLGRKLASAAAGLALVAGGAFVGINALNQPPKEDPVPTAPADPNETEPGVPAPAPVETETPIGDGFEIPAGLDAETLAKTLVEDRITTWYNAGAADSLVDDFMESRNRDVSVNEAWAEFTKELAAKNREELAPALFGSDYENNPGILQLASNMQWANENILNGYTATQWSDDPENQEGYRYELNVLSAKELEDDDPNDNIRQIETVIQGSDNSDKNTANIGESSKDPATVIYTITEENGVAYVTNVVNKG